MAFAIAPTENNIKPEIVFSNSTDVWVGVATTQKQYGKNYSVSIEVHGTRTSYSKSIEKVLVDGKRINYEKDINKNDSYWFNHNRERYYFTF
tara:strand:+ start:256 stop:531 length:276 start_codon:yes stop_codon:yes gene_type:complete